MTEPQAVEAISAAIVAGWTAAQPAIPIVLDNEAAPTADAFAQVSIRHGASVQATMGPPGQRRWKRSVAIYVRLFGPVDAGRAGLSALVETVRGIVEGASLGGTSSLEPVTCGATMTREMGADGRWWSCATQTSAYYWSTR